MPLYPHPLSPGYWRSAAGELKHLRRLVFMALMIAACIVLSHCSIRLGESLSLSVTFLARALCSLVCGPLAVIVFGAAEDTLSFFLSSGGYPYFPGYMLTTITGCMIYALFFYRARSRGGASFWPSSSPISRMCCWAPSGAPSCTARATSTT